HLVVDKVQDGGGIVAESGPQVEVGLERDGAALGGAAFLVGTHGGEPVVVSEPGQQVDEGLGEAARRAGHGGGGRRWLGARFDRTHDASRKDGRTRGRRYPEKYGPRLWRGQIDELPAHARYCDRGGRLVIGGGSLGRLPIGRHDENRRGPPIISAPRSCPRSPFSASRPARWCRGTGSGPSARRRGLARACRPAGRRRRD